MFAEKEKYQNFLEAVSEEGLDYTVNYFGDWKEIQDFDPALYNYIRLVQFYRNELEVYLGRLEKYIDDVQN